MTNREHFKKDVDYILSGDTIVAVMKNVNRPVSCCCIGCAECLFLNSPYSCGEASRKWLEEEYHEREL